jgi:threonine dehydrogenase-like Zn-dependent dehydrogenase
MRRTSQLVGKFPMGSFMNRSLIMRTGQCYVQHLLEEPAGSLRARRDDPSLVNTHRLELGQAPQGYDTFLNQEDHCIKVVLKP